MMNSWSFILLINDMYISPNVKFGTGFIYSWILYNKLFFPFKKQLIGL